MNREVLKAVSFPVEKRKIYFKDGDGMKQIEGKEAVVRTDTLRALSVVSEQYELVPYQEVVEPILEQIDKHGGTLVTRDFGRRASPVRIEGDGKRVWLEAKFNDGITIGKDLIVPRLVYGNSYDTTAAVRMIVGFFQVKCTNAGALMTPGEIRGLGSGDLWAQHSKRYKDELAKIGPAIKSFLSQFGERADSLRAMANITVDPDKAERIAIQVMGERALGKKPLEPRDHESAWAFYSRITNYLTIDFKGGQQPAESRAAWALAEIQKLMH